MRLITEGSTQYKSFNASLRRCRLDKLRKKTLYASLNSLLTGVAVFALNNLFGLNIFLELFFETYFLEDLEAVD